MSRYYTVKLFIALQNSGFKGFLAEGLEKSNFDAIFSSGIINLLFDGLTYNTRGHFAHCSYFILAPSGLEKILRNSQNIRAYYMSNHRIRCMLYTARCISYICILYFSNYVNTTRLD